MTRGLFFIIKFFGIRESRVPLRGSLIFCAFRVPCVNSCVV
ncbi:hypothetical protein VPH70E344B_0222 [Vibrio phage 70E34-4b]